MNRVSKTALLIGVAVLAGATFAGAAYAQATANNNSGALVDSVLDGVDAAT